MKAVKVAQQEAKQQLRHEIDKHERTDTQNLIDALEFEIQMMNTNLKIAQKNVDRNRVQLKIAKDNVLNLRASQGWAPESIEMAIEQNLKEIDVHVEAYHGGKFNGKSCWCILDNTKIVMDNITKVILERRQKDTNEKEERIIELMQNYEQLPGKLDGTLAQLTIINPTKQEIEELEREKNPS